MVPTPSHLSSSRLPRLLITLASVASQYVPNLAFSGAKGTSNSDGNPHGSILHSFAKRELKSHDPEFIVFACLIPILVVLSGLFAGLTLGYMSLDETQLNVLSISGSPEQKRYANKIKPIRKDGHLLLVTLLLANMIVNETLPVISDPVLGGGVQSVVVSTVLIVIFSEIIPQSLCTRYGLYFGAKMAGFMHVLLWTLGIVAWPVARLLELVLGPHHGIIYRRAELKELIAMHASVGEYGGDLKTDTVNIIGGALDLQEKVVKQAMTPIEDVFMLSIDAKLDYETLRRICLTGHSRIPVYEEVEVPIATLIAVGALNPKEAANADPSINLASAKPETQKVKKIVGILLVKQCVLLDPKDATPVRMIPLNRVPFVPNNEPLLGILDRFQEGRSHMAIVSRYSVTRAASVKTAVKRGLTQRLRDRVGFGDSDSSSTSSGSDTENDGSGFPRVSKRKEGKRSESEGSTTDRGSMSDADGRASRKDGRERHKKSKRRSNKRKSHDLEMGDVDVDIEDVEGRDEDSREKSKATGLMSNLTIPRASFGMRQFEQSMPADAVLTTQGAEEFLQGVDPAVMPLGIITLEDVLEELIGEEIYDEFDPQGHPDLTSYGRSEVIKAASLKRKSSAPNLTVTNDTTFGNGFHHNVAADGSKSLTATPTMRPTVIPSLRNLNLMGLSLTRSRSAPPTPRDSDRKGDLPAHSTVPEGFAIKEDETPEDMIPPLEDNIQNRISLDTSPTLTESFPHPIFATTPPQTLERVESATRSKPTVQIRAPDPVIAQASSSVVPNPNLLYPGISRSASPAPSLEQAILVERKRRATSGNIASPVPKGARFKSSPLTGGRNGVVVAEKVKRNIDADDGKIGDVRIPNEWDKSGPDKEW